MTRSIVCVLGLAAVAGVAREAEPPVPATPPSVSSAPRPAAADNPALARFGRSVVFYAGYEGQAVAEITDGNPAPRGNPAWAEAAKDGTQLYPAGVYGQGLRSGLFQLVYESAKPVLGTTGAVVLWVKPEKLNHAGSYWWPVILDTFGDSAYRVMFGRMGDPRNREVLYAHLAHGKATVSACVGASMADWKPGEWHLLAVNWDAAGVEFSVDGALPERASLKVPLPAAARGGLRITFLSPDNDVLVVDELMVLDLPLRPDDIAWLWAQRPAPAR